jgi:two-component system KDP operon response regulator KdpE
MAGTILIVEDDRDCARAMAQRLRAEGYETLLAQDAYQATRLARHDHPDLIIMDVGIPAGDGVQVHARLNDMPCGAAPVIYVSGRGGDELEKRARELGAAAVFRKPVDFDVLLRAVNGCMRPWTDAAAGARSPGAGR